VDGILIIDKPAGLTSHDVVSRVRRILGTRRVGHTGTLDPFATGVMVIVVGKATKLARFLDKDVKEYIADVKFGFETDTGDHTGRPNAECGMRNEEIVRILEATDWDTVLSKFRGEIMQTPPMYSAKKIDGKKLYELARKGEVVARAPVHVTIHELEVLSGEFNRPDPGLRIRVLCSAGTYIRTLAEDIGRETGIGAHLTALRRTAAGRFSIHQAITLDALQDATEPSANLLPLEDAVSHLPEFKLRDDRVEPTRNGLATQAEDVAFQTGEHLRTTDRDGQLIAIGVYNAAEKSIRPKIVLI
jgi:tRNA pseudouridine55 synthase